MRTGSCQQAAPCGARCVRIAQDSLTSETLSPTSLLKGSWPARRLVQFWSLYAWHIFRIGSGWSTPRRGRTGEPYERFTPPPKLLPYTATLVSGLSLPLPCIFHLQFKPYSGVFLMKGYTPLGGGLLDDQSPLVWTKVRVTLREPNLIAIKEVANERNPYGSQVGEGPHAMRRSCMGRHGWPASDSSSGDVDACCDSCESGRH
jgi:hypothetical protein